MKINRRGLEISEIKETESERERERERDMRSLNIKKKPNYKR